MARERRLTYAQLIFFAQLFFPNFTSQLRIPEQSDGQESSEIGERNPL